MAQRKPTPIQPAVELVRDEAGLMASDPLTRAFQRPTASTSTQLLAHRQGAAMKLLADRAIFAISETMEVNDHASALATASLQYINHLERGFVEGELGEDEQLFYDAMRRMIMDGSLTIAAEAGEALRKLARDLELPSTRVARWEAFLLDLQTRW